MILSGALSQVKAWRRLAASARLAWAAAPDRLAVCSHSVAQPTCTFCFVGAADGELVERLRALRAFAGEEPPPIWTKVRQALLLAEVQVHSHRAFVQDRLAGWLPRRDVSTGFMTLAPFAVAVFESFGHH